MAIRGSLLQRSHSSHPYPRVDVSQTVAGVPRPLPKRSPQIPLSRISNLKMYPRQYGIWYASLLQRSHSSHLHAVPHTVWYVTDSTRPDMLRPRLLERHIYRSNAGLQLHTHGLKAHEIAHTLPNIIYPLLKQSHSSHLHTWPQTLWHFTDSTRHSEITLQPTPSRISSIVRYYK